MRFFPPALRGRALAGVLAASLLAGPGPAGSASARGESPPPAAPRRVEGLLGRLAARLAPATAAARGVLLGSRDPAGPSCVPLSVDYDPRVALQPFAADPDGGPGTRLTAFWLGGRRGSAVEDHRWQQGPFRAELERLLRACRRSQAALEPLAADARDLAEAFASWPTWRGAVAAPSVAERPDWPGLCLARLARAAAAKDLPACRRWSAELASATFALVDLHRWEAFLLTNHLELLDFQADGEEHAAWADRLWRAHGRKYQFDTAKDYFAPSAHVYGLLRNLAEVERQAERLYAPPADWAAAPPASGPAGWLPPDVRESFALLRRVLSAANARTWDRAAAEPFHRSYLANVLFRLGRSGAVLDLAVTLKRFDRAHPAADVSELMDAVFYRGEPCSGLVWRDRFDRRIVAAAGRMRGDDLAVLQGAQSAVFRLLDGWKNYAGRVWSLREVLNGGKLDCVRGTDLIAALFRNAGRAGVYPVHLSCGVATHSMAAAAVGPAERRRIVLADPFRPGEAGGATWPEAFYRGYRWPKGYPGDYAPPITAELTARGLDNYVFAEGYVIRGPRAGVLRRAAIPYLPGRQRTEVVRTYDGPYPAPPTAISAAPQAGPTGKPSAVQ